MTTATPTNSRLVSPPASAQFAGTRSSRSRLYGVKRRTVNIVTILCGLFAVFTLIPIWWIFVSSTKTAPNLN